MPMSHGTNTDEHIGLVRPHAEASMGKRISAFFYRHGTPDARQPSLLHFSSMPLFRLERSQGKYAHLLKKKDLVNIGPIVNYFIRNSGQIAYLGGDVLRNLNHHGRRKYKTLNILVILTEDDIDKYSFIMNNVISSNDGAFSMGFKYWVKKNRCEGCFKEIALARYIVEPRLEGLEKLWYVFRPAPIELNLTTEQRFSEALGVLAS